MSFMHEIKGQVGWLTLNRPEALNSLSREMVEALTEQLLRWRDDPQVRVLVLSGQGRAFCAGADLKQANERSEPGQPNFLDVLVAFFGTLRSYPKPVIAAVNGIALAGGLEVVLACDLVIAAESARLGDAHANFGVFPGGGGAALLPRKVPANVANYLLFTGEALPAAELKVHGLVNEVVADEQLCARVQALAEKMAQKSPVCLLRMKRVASESCDKPLADALRHELLELHNHQRSYDIQEGLSAFLEKRLPQFKGI